LILDTENLTLWVITVLHTVTARNVVEEKLIITDVNTNVLNLTFSVIVLAVSSAVAVHVVRFV